MSFRITGLAPEAFAPLLTLSDEALAAKTMRWMPVERQRSAPCRITLEDATPGERVLLMNYEHQPADTPFRAAHAIFIRDGARKRYDRIDQVPPALRVRPLSLRGFDKDHMMIDAALVDGDVLEGALETMLAKSNVAYVQLHYAMRGCYAARAERA